MINPSGPKNSPGLKDPGDFVKEAYALEDDDKRVAFYRKWADEYDHQMLDELGYISPGAVAQLLADYLPYTGARIVDIGCGTGLTCTFLHRQGYQYLDGVDLSPDMLRVAGNRKIYRKLMVADLNQPLDIPDASYDAAISSGTFTHGHVGPEPLGEIFRILKPQGILACTVHLDLWRTKGFEARFDALVNSGLIECLSLVKGQYYEQGELEGWFCVYRKQ